MEHIAGGDPFEMGSSRPLDFGHWAAHKLEQLSDYRLRHGEAVAIGIALDVTYSFLKNHIDKAAWQRIIRLMHELGFEVFTPELNMKQAGRLVVLEGLDEFREHLGGQLTIMLLEQVGRGFEVHEMDEGLIREAIQLLERIHQTATIS
jgi:3-dehydroquinate synthase